MTAKIKGSYDTEIYPTEGGYVAIAQDGQPGQEERKVLLAAHQLADVIAELQALLDDRASWEFSEDDDEVPPVRFVSPGSSGPDAH